MKVGNTFIWHPHGTVKEHLWILISDPAANEGRCVIVNLTSSSHGKYSFTLNVGQHPFITKPSDVNFGDAMRTTETELARNVASGAALQREDMDASIVASIITAAKTHPAFPPILRKLLPP